MVFKKTNLFKLWRSKKMLIFWTLSFIIIIVYLMLSLNMYTKEYTYENLIHDSSFYVRQMNWKLLILKFHEYHAIWQYMDQRQYTTFHRYIIATFLFCQRLSRTSVEQSRRKSTKSLDFTPATSVSSRANAPSSSLSKASHLAKVNPRGTPHC